jgi:hypothetical protein
LVDDEVGWLAGDPVPDRKLVEEALGVETRDVLGRYYYERGAS